MVAVSTILKEDMLMQKSNLGQKTVAMLMILVWIMKKKKKKKKTPKMSSLHLQTNKKFLNSYFIFESNVFQTFIFWWWWSLKRKLMQVKVENIIDKTLHYIPYPTLYYW